MKKVVVRTISGVAFIIIMVAAILASKYSYIAIILLMIYVMTNEYFRISNNSKYSIITLLLVLTTSIYIFLCSYLIESINLCPKYLLMAAVPIMAIFISNLYIKSYNSHKNIVVNSTPVRVNNGYEAYPNALIPIFYICIPLSMTSLIVFDNGNYSGKLLLSMFIILWASDVGAYCFGSTLGQKFGKKLFESISPKKSWIGFLGGLFCSIIAAIVLHYCYLLALPAIESIILSIIICVFGVLGDLVESQLKRNFGAKDSGTFMPGHGGLLDRFDGALISFPLAIIYLEFFTNVA